VGGDPKTARIYAIPGRFQWPKSAGRLRSKTALTPRPKSKNGVKKEKKAREEGKSQEARSVSPSKWVDISSSPDSDPEF